MVHSNEGQTGMMKDLHNLWLNLNVSLLCTYLRKIVLDSFFSQWFRCSDSDGRGQLEGGRRMRQQAELWRGLTQKLCGVEVGTQSVQRTVV